VLSLETDTEIENPYGDRDMKSLVIPMALSLALSVPAALAKDGNNGNGNNGNGNNGNGNNGNGNNGNGNGNVRGAPGPLIGAGLPVLLIGGGIYWLVRRKNRASSSTRSQG
jgi:hypothetical protein